MDLLHSIFNAIAGEFSDLPDVERFVQLVVRLTAALVLGGALGYEREHAGKQAGMRTHMLVALGAAMFILVPDQAGADNAAISRILQGLIAGIGFLGGGTILKLTDHAEVRGLTTAAGIWLTAAIGVAVGMGRILTATIATVLALLVLIVHPHVFGRGKS